MAKDAQTESRIIAGLDIGTTKVTCAIGRFENGQLDIIGVGNAANTGMRHGVVVNIDSTSDSIRKAKDEAELMAGVRIDGVWLGIGGQHVQSFSSAGMVAVRHKEVRQEDIDRVIEAAKAVAIPQDRQVLHVLPQDFKLDGQVGIFDPIGMSGVRLEASVFIVTGSIPVIQNAVKCAQKVGLRVDGMVLQQLASAMSVLSADEKNLGVCLADVGGGTADLITFFQGSVIHTGLLPVGGSNFTHDIAIGLKTTQSNAETLKRKYGCALPEMISEDESIEVESVGGRKPRTLMRRDLCEVIEARAEETLELIRRELDEKGLIGKLGSGVVLTGGASLLHGLVEMGDFVLDVPVRKGWPEKVGGLVDVVRQPSCSAVVGVMFYGLSQEKERALGPEMRVSEWTKRMKHLLGM